MSKDNLLLLALIVPSDSSASLRPQNQFHALKGITAQHHLKLQLHAQLARLETLLKWELLLNAQIVKWECSAVKLVLDRLKVCAIRAISVFPRLLFLTQLMEQLEMCVLQEDSAN